MLQVTAVDDRFGTHTLRITARSVRKPRKLLVPGSGYTPPWIGGLDTGDRAASLTVR
jgi:hypothetical protein